jgi:ribosomal protein L34
MKYQPNGIERKTSLDAESEAQIKSEENKHGFKIRNKNNQCGSLYRIS